VNSTDRNIINVLFQDERITTTQIVLYLALYNLFLKRGIVNSVFISRRDVMEMAKIKSFYTYHQGIQNLQKLGYIDYRPSYHPHKKTIVRFLKGVGDD
jgi:hypothetical protein